MSDSIEKIAEDAHDAGRRAESADFPALAELLLSIAARLRAIASPEREAFLKAADELIVAERAYLEHGEIPTGPIGMFRDLINDAVAKHRAWKEAQRG